MTGTNSTSIDAESGDTTMLDFAIALAKHKRLVLGLPLLAGLLSLVVSLLIPPTYTAVVRILPPQQKESAAAAVLGALAGPAGSSGASSIGQVLGLKNPNELYAGILRGHTIADRVIERFKLKELYEVETLVDARGALEDITKISAGRDGLIAIEVDDGDPQRAADLANAYVEELDRLMQGLAVTEAGQRRLFFEKQLARAQDQLLAAEGGLRRAIQTKGITGVGAQTQGVVNTSEQLRAQIAVKVIQLDAMRAFATERNPEAVRLRQELESMRSELAKLEGGRPQGNSVQSPAGLESIRKLREVKFLEFSVELLTKQYEIAKIDEAKDAILIQVVDRATAPDYKSKPRRAVIVVVTTVAFGLIALLAAFLLEALERARQDPQRSSRLQILRQHLRWR